MQSKKWCKDQESIQSSTTPDPRYSHIRDELVTSISQVTNLTITTDVFLFGTDEVSGEIYTPIFKAEIYKAFKANTELADAYVFWTLDPKTNHWYFHSVHSVQNFLSLDTNNSHIMSHFGTNSCM